MTVEESIFTVVSALCARTFPDFAPTSTARPYVTYQQIGGQAVTFTAAEVPNLKNGEFQINVWADTRAAAVALMLQIETALTVSTAFQAKPLAAPFSDFDADMLRYCSRQDFSIWSAR